MESNSWLLVRRRALLHGGCHRFPASKTHGRRFFYLTLVLNVFAGTIEISLTIRIGYFDNQVNSLDETPDSNIKKLNYFRPGFRQQ